jgi:hypothetical protein
MRSPDVRPEPAPPVRRGLAALRDARLAPEREAWLLAALSRGGGGAVWRARRACEARELLGLERIAGGRLHVCALDCTDELRAIVRLRAPVPCWPPASPEPVIGHEVELVLRYPEEVLRQPLPGTALVRIVRPRHVFLPNVSPEGAFPGEPQALCLGASLPRGLPLREVVLASYAAFTLQAVTLDEADAAGVLNRAAAAWWQRNIHRVPLSREPFLAQPAPEDRP